MMHWKISLVIAALLTSMTGAALHYRALYLGAEQAQQHIQAQAEAQHAALAQVNRQMQTVAALDLQHTRELENDKKHIAQLEHDVAAGRRRLHAKVTVQSALPAPAAWAIQEPSNSLKLLDETFSLSDLESSATKQK
ncbi:Rz1 family lipoprotein [Sodalis glossinidius]|uniref:lysis system i-spanin subunit Rz n=1 Tax=Sodalis glossinidius TaxID=63612 RepID=UPI00068196C9